MRKRNLIDFIPGEIVFRIDHDEDPGPAAIAARLESQYNSSSSSPKLPSGIYIDPERVLTFDRGEATGCLGGIVQIFWAINQAISWKLGQQLKRQRTRYFSIAFTELPGRGYDELTDEQIAEARIVSASIKSAKSAEKSDESGSEIPSSGGDRDDIRKSDDDVGKVVSQDEELLPPLLQVSDDKLESLLDTILEINQAIDLNSKSYRVPGEQNGLRLYGNANLSSRVSDWISGLAHAPSPFEIRAANFNWMTAAAQSIPVGGPGARPEPIAGASIQDIPIEPLSGSTPNRVQQEEPHSEQIKKSVDVFILDTAPRWNLIVNNQQPRVAGARGTISPVPNTPLTEGVTADPKRLRISWETMAVPKSLPNPQGAANMMAWLGSDGHTGVVIQSQFEPTNPNFDQSAHGIFIADIICNVTRAKGIAGVPQHIHLIEVLSKWGSGTLETVTRGLHKVHKQLPTSAGRAVINCSFTFQIPRVNTGKIPRKGHLSQFDRYEQPFRDNMDQMINHPKSEQDINSVLEPIFELLSKDALIVAAAGNEWDGGNASDRPIARYPAAYNTVIGVAALSQRNRNPGTAPQVARYSSRADQPESDGFAVYGGDVVVNLNRLYANPHNSIAGLYMGDFPDGRTGKKEKWQAYWSGTSFAAPIVTAALAVELARGKRLKAALKQLRDRNPDKTDQGEEVLWITK